MSKLKTNFLKQQLNRTTALVEDLYLPIKVSPSLFFWGVIFGFILGFIVTSPLPEFSNQKTQNLHIRSLETLLGSSERE